MTGGRIEDETSKLMRDILEASKEGLTKREILDKSDLSYPQLRDITAELADKKFLRDLEPDGIYITTDKGLKFLEAVKDAEVTANKACFQMKL